jgi:hypothetical protein
MPVVPARIHYPPLKESRPRDAPDGGVAQTSEFVMLPSLIFQVMSETQLKKAALLLRSRMVAEEASDQNLNLLLYDYCNCWVLICDRRRDYRPGYIICFSLCLMNEMEKGKCSTFMSSFQKVANNK